MDDGGRAYGCDAGSPLGGGANDWRAGPAIQRVGPSSNNAPPSRTTRFAPLFAHELDTRVTFSADAHAGERPANGVHRGTVSTFALKLILTPTLIGLVSLAGRRWGPVVGGLLVGLPLTSGPVAFFLTLEQGTAFAASAAVGTMAGIMSVAAFAVAYGRAAAKHKWPEATLLGWSAYLGTTVAFAFLELRLFAVFVSVLVTLGIALAMLPKAAAVRRRSDAPWWDIPARMFSATLFLLLLTGLAGLLGPRLSGLLAPFPIYGTVLAVAAHHFEGSAAAAGLLRGVAAGSFAFASFFLVLALALERHGLAPAFGAAIVASLSVQAFVAWRMRPGGAAAHRRL